MSNSAPVQLRCHTQPQVSCNSCRLAALCLPLSLNVDDIEKVDNVIQRNRPLHRGEFLYQAHSPFKSVFAVRAGTIKTLTLTGDGQEQVTGFYLPGEILGMDGIATGEYSNSAIALETSSVCEIPFDRLEELTLSIPTLQRHLFQLLSKEITQEQQLVRLLSKNSAEERVATLLISISSRNKRRQLSSSQFRLPMSRSDIGNYLGLTVETVSRIFSRFQKQNFIRVDKKEIEITQMESLQRLANPSIFDVDELPRTELPKQEPL